MAASPMRRYPADVARAFGHTPVEAALAAFLALMFSWALEIDAPESYRVFQEVLLLVLLAAAAAWSGTILHALGDGSGRLRWALTGAGVAVAAVLGWFFLDLERESEVWRAGTLALSAWLVAFAAPALAPGVDPLLRFRRVGGRLLLRVIGAGLYAAALFAGLALAIAAVDNLFELDMEGTIYGHVFGWIAFAVAPWIVLGGLDDLTRPLDERRETAAVIHRIAGWLVVPLFVLYYGILYAYAVRIVVVGELPRNLVSPLVTAAGLLAALALVLFDPGPGERRPVRALRISPLLFLPLVALGAHAILVRVGQYGWTEFRYLRLALVAALAVLALGAVWQLVRRRAFAVHLAPVVLSVVLALSVVGPWSALAVSERSQRGRLVDGLERAGLMADGVAEPADTTGGRREVPEEVHQTIRTTGWYLVRHFGPESVSPPLPPGFLEDDDGFRDLPTMLGLQAIMPADMRQAAGGSLPMGVPFPAGEDLVQRVRLTPGRQVPGESPGAGLRDSTNVVVRIGGDVLEADLEPLISWFVVRGLDAPRGRMPEELAAVPLLDGDGRERGHLLVLELAVGTPDGPRTLVHLEGLALVRR